MELVDGADLLSYVRGDSNAFDERRLRHGFAQLALAVRELHDHGLIHQDLKPSNVLVDKTGRVVVLDFGLAHDAGMDIDEWGRHISDWGTPAYIAPERRHGDTVEPGSDWFSVGCILYRALIGTSPKRINRENNQEAITMPVARASLLKLEDDTIPMDLSWLCRALLDSDPATRAGAEEVLSTCRATDSGRVEQPALPFVGRAAELTSLRGAYSVVARGHAAIAVVHGASGVGKTALAEHFIESLMLSHAAPFVLDGRCYERESVPYKGFDSVASQLAAMLRAASEDELRHFDVPDAHLLSRLFPSLVNVPIASMSARGDSEPALRTRATTARLRSAEDTAHPRRDLSPNGLVARRHAVGRAPTPID